MTEDFYQNNNNLQLFIMGCHLPVSVYTRPELQSTDISKDCLWDRGVWCSSREYQVHVCGQQRAT